MVSRLHVRREGTLLSLDHAQPIAERYGLDTVPHTVANEATDTDGTLAWDSQVADAMCHLLSGYLIVEDVSGASARTLSRPPTALDVIAKNISSALRELNECSLEIWLFPQAGTRASAGLRGFCRRFNLWRDPTMHHPLNLKPRQPIVSDFVTEGSGALGSHWSTHSEDSRFIMQPEWEERLAAALLHLVGAYRAMERLSRSPLPSGAPCSFAVACHCLCTALAVLDMCVSRCDE